MTQTKYIAKELAALLKDNPELLNNAFRKTRDDFPYDQSQSNYSDKSPLEKQIDLKKKVSKELNGSFVNWKVDEWIVKEWGGIRSFKIDKGKGDKRIIGFESELKNRTLTCRSYSVISSLSKIASFVNPEEFFVYDSRVAYSLNVLIMEYNQEDVKNED